MVLREDSAGVVLLMGF